MSTASSASSSSPPTLPRLSLAGAPTLLLPGAAAQPLAPLDGALLAWLALEGPTPRSRLAALLWPASDAEAARNSLRQRLFKLRRQCGVDLALGSVTLALADGIEHDLEDSDSVLGDESAPVGGEYDGWLEQQRRRRRERTLRSLQDLSEAAEQAGDWTEALAHAHEWLNLAPLSEEAHRRLIRLHYLKGDRAAALLAFDRCERTLKDEVGVAPSAETMALLRLVETAGAPAQRPRRQTPVLPASVLRPPRLVGREAELRAVDDAWAQGHVVALVGEAGMGKSRLLQHVLPAGSLSVAARPGDSGVPLATLARLLRAVAERAPQALAAPVRSEIARVLPEWADAGTPTGAGQRLQLHRAVASVLAGIADLPALALDDLHFADAASLQLLHALLEEDNGQQRWALAYRPAEAGSALHVLNEGLLEQARLATVRLAPLGLEALAALVDSLELPGISGERLAPGLLTRTGGNPLYMLETLKQAWVDERLAARSEPGSLVARPAANQVALSEAGLLPRPSSVLRLVERRLVQLSPQALALARCAAVAGQDFSAPLASRVLGVPALALADAWAELESAQILRDDAFVHDLIQEAALGSVPAVIARQLHGEIAAHLETEGRAAAARVAHHWLDAGQPGRAAPLLERAAKDAARVLEPTEAARMWGQLAELRHAEGDHEAAFAAALEAVALVRSETSGPPLAAAIARLQALARTPEQRAQGFELRAAMHHMRGEAEAAAEALDKGLAVLPADAPPELRVLLLNMQGAVLRRAGRTAEARQAFEQALALCRQAPDNNLPAVLNNLGLLLQDLDEHLAAIALMQEAAERQPDALVRARVINNLGISLEERGQAALAREQCLAAARLVQGSAAVVEINLAIRLGANARTLGRWREALAHLDRAEELLREQPNKREHELHRVRAGIWLDLGRPNLAREALGRAAALAAERPVDAAHVAVVQGRLALLLGQDPSAALRAAEAAAAAASDLRARRRLRLVLAQALGAEDALPLLQALAEEPALRDNAAAALPVEVRLAQALLALQRPAEALRHAQRAADWLQALQPVDMAPAEVWLTLARCALAAGDAGQAAWVAQRGAQDLQRGMHEHLDVAFHESFLQRNPVHRDLTQLEERLARDKVA